MTTLQASLLLSLSRSPTPSSKFKRFQLSRSSASFTWTPNLYQAAPPSCQSFGFIHRTLSISCTFHPDNASTNQESDLAVSSEVEESSFNEFNGGSSSVSNVGKPETEEFGGESLDFEVESTSGEKGLENGDGKSEKVAETEGKSGNLVGQKKGNGMPLVVFLMGLWATTRSGLSKVLASDWFSWWPFSQQEKRLERLIAEADANPKDAVKQSALLAELNKHRLSHRV